MENVFSKNDRLSNFTVEERVDKDGAIAFKDYRFPEIKIDLPEFTRSDVNYRVIARNSYGIAGLALIAGAIDFYCTNGMIKRHL